MTRVIALSLGFLNAVSIILLLQINLGLLPLFPSSLSEERTSKINGLVSDLCQGVIVSTFFYLLLVYLPEQEKARRIRALVQPRLRTITEKMEQSLLYLLTQSGQPPEAITKPSLDALSSFPGITGAKMNFKYQVLYDDGKWVPHIIPVTDIEHFQRERNDVRQSIEAILALPHIADENDDLIDLLPRLRDCAFYDTIQTYARWGTCVNAPEFLQDFYHYWCMYSRLKKISGTRPIRITPDP